MFGFEWGNLPTQTSIPNPVRFRTKEAKFFCSDPAGKSSLERRSIKATYQL